MMTGSDLQALLRLHPEPYEFHDDWRVHAALTARPRAYLDHLLGALQEIADGHVALELPPKSVFSDPGERSDFRVMPCVTRFAGRVRKTVKIIGTNWPRQIVPGEISVGQAYSLHATENFIEAGFAGCILSSARTGACVATAMRLLAPEHGTVAIVGAGRVGFYAGLYAAALGGVRRLLFADVLPERASLAARLLHAAHPDIATGTFDSRNLAARPDVLVLATDSESALFDATGHRPALVVSVGADTHWQREVAPAVLGHYALFVDTLDSLQHGDLHAFGEAGLLQGRAAVDLMGMLRDPAARNSPALFISTGSALFDNLTIDYLLGSGLLSPAAPR